MNAKSTRAAVQEVLAVLRDPTAEAPRDASHWLGELRAKGFLNDIQLDDLVAALDPRTANRSRKGWVELAGLRWASYSRRPKASEDRVSIVPGLSAVEVALYLVALERVGLRVDPKPFVDLVLANLGKDFLSGDELTVYWYAKSRHRGDALRFPDGPIGDTSPSGLFETATGYLVEVRSMDDGTVAGLVVHAPRPRNQGARLVAADLRSTLRSTPRAGRPKAA